jgi:alcohol dehydrogenase class IV
MVNKFTFIRTPRILFGRGQLEGIPALLKDYGQRILVIKGKRSHLSYPEIGKVFPALENDGFVTYHESIDREPSPAWVDQITEKYRQQDIKVVVAIGGGSVMDTGKAVSAMLPLEGSVRDYLEGIGNKIHTGIKIPFIAIPTTSGTGSEATANAVLAETGSGGFKRSLRHENLVPDIALVDPQLMTGCPPAITAASGMDAFTQLLESYLSIRSGMVTDALALEGISRVHLSLVKAVEQGEDIGARSDMAYAALLSGITLSNAGLGLIHGFASAIGGLFDIPHGVICGTLMCAVNRHMINALFKQNAVSAAHEKYAFLGRLLSGRHDKDMIWNMRYTADYIDEFTERLAIPRLGKYGIEAGHLHQIADLAEHKANPVKFEREELVEMLKERL